MKSKNNVEISRCGQYRYWLHAQIDPARSYYKTVVFIMINPSTADAENDDRTIESCKRIAKFNGFTDLVVLNLFPYRTKDVDELTKFIETASDYDLKQMFDENEARIDYLKEFKPHTIIAAWGCIKKAPDVLARAAVIRDKFKMKCLGVNKDNSPRHPLFKAEDTPLIDYGV